MTDNILQGTLGSSSSITPPNALIAPNSTGNNKTDISNLKAAQAQPSSIISFQDVLRRSSQEAYNQRQSSELNNLSFDPSKVSGNLFANVIGNLEANRGKDISSIYQSTMSIYMKVQDSITSRLEHLEDLEEQKRQFNEEMKMKEKELKELRKTNERAYKMEKEKFEMDKKSWEVSYTKAKKELNQATAVDYSKFFSTLHNGYIGSSEASFDPDSYISSYSSGGGW